MGSFVLIGLGGSVRWGASQQIYPIPDVPGALRFRNIRAKYMFGVAPAPRFGPDAPRQARA
jgi:hypothetical protein